MKLKKLAAAALVSVATLGGFGTAQAVPVALELSLVIDVSGSVDALEYDLQIKGYKAAFESALVQGGITSFADGIAVNVIQFSDNASQAIGWTLLKTTADINAFAASIGSMGRLFGGGTDVQDGMLLGISSFNNNGYEGVRKVIDVSGDGHQNTDPACTISGPSYNQSCASVQAARDSATAAGIVINGLAIEDGTYGTTGLTNWYNTNVKTSDGFVVTANDFGDFAAAATLKIGKEITGQVPEPGTLALVGLALAGVGASVRRRRA